MLACRFKPAVAPLKAAVFPLVQSKELDEVARRISTKLLRAGLANTVDTTGEQASPALYMTRNVPAVVAPHMVASTCSFTWDPCSMPVGRACTALIIPPGGMHCKVRGSYCLCKSVLRGSAEQEWGCVAGTTIGKRYARTDELGIPFAITVDRDTLDAGDKQGTVTVRERDSTSQVKPFTCPCFHRLSIRPHMY